MVWLGVIAGIIGLITLFVLGGFRRRVVRDVAVEFSRWSVNAPTTEAKEAMASTVRGLKDSLESALEERDRGLLHG